MRRSVLLALVLLSAAARAEGQASLPAAALDGLAIRVEGGGNQLIARREAPVAYTRLEQIAGEIQQPSPTGAAAIEVVRASPQERIDYLLCVTSDGTLVVGERLQTFDQGEGRWVFTRGAITRSFRPLEAPDGWLWLVEVALSRETTVTLVVRAQARWPVESVTVTADRAP